MGTHHDIGRYSSVPVLLTAVLVIASNAYSLVNGGSTDDGINSQEGLEPSGPKEIFRSEGGSVEIWSSNSSVLQDAAVAVTRITLRSRGLGIPKYSDAAQLAYVLEGTAHVGLAYPWEQSIHVLSVKKGDVIAIPRGVVHWLYNGGDEQFVILGIADTSSGKSPGEYESFYLEGATTKEWGSGILHGFDEVLLSHAWDMDIDVVKQIKEGQKGTVIVKVLEDILTPIILAIGEDSKSVWESYVYNIDDAEPDIKVSNGGSFSMLTSKELPILREVFLTAVHLTLDSGALFGPTFTTNAHLLVCVTGGSGRVQIVGSGKQLLDAEVKEGSILMIPQFHPVIITSGSEGLQIVAMATSDAPLFSFLAGKNALDMGIPIEILAASNNVSIEVQQVVQDHRQTDAVIFPPRGKSSATSRTAVVSVKLNFLILLLSSLFLIRFQKYKHVLVQEKTPDVGALRVNLVT